MTKRSLIAGLLGTAMFFALPAFGEEGKRAVQIKQLSAKELGMHIIDHKYEIKLPDGSDFGFDLVDPEVAPPEIRQQVMYGYRLVIDTQHYASDYIRAHLNCTCCHFCGGNTLGGRNGSISLVGVPNIYPRYSPRDKKVISLEDRINNCFMKSLNGIPLPKDSEEMKSILAFLNWISKDVATLKKVPWLGLQIVKSSHKPDLKAGAQVYIDRCAACHQTDGGGAKDIPPLWGKNSFNTGAGMNNLQMISAFVYWNMPYQEPVLTIEEAIDVSAYITNQPRPTFIPPQTQKTAEEKKSSSS